MSGDKTGCCPAVWWWEEVVAEACACQMKIHLSLSDHSSLASPKLYDTEKLKKSLSIMLIKFLQTAHVVLYKQGFFFSLAQNGPVGGVSKHDRSACS